MKNKGVAAVVGAGVLWGIINIFIKRLSSAGLSPMQIALLRLTVAAAALSALTLLKNPESFKIRLRDIWMFIGTGIISVSLFNFFYFYTIINGEASVAVVLLYTSPVFIVVMASVLFKERITGRKALACLLTLAGCVLTSGLLKATPNVSGRVFTAGLASGFLYALYTVFGRYALEKYGAGTVTVYTFLFGLAGTFFMTDKSGIAGIIRNEPVLVLYIIGLGIVSTVLPYYLYTYGLQRMESGKAAIYVAIEPAVGAAIGMTLFGEDRSALKILGIILVLTAIAVMNTGEKENDGGESFT